MGGSLASTCSTLRPSHAPSPTSYHSVSSSLPSVVPPHGVNEVNVESRVNDVKEERPTARFVHRAHRPPHGSPLAISHHSPPFIASVAAGSSLPIRSSHVSLPPRFASHPPRDTPLRRVLRSLPVPSSLLRHSAVPAPAAGDGIGAATRPQVGRHPPRRLPSSLTPPYDYRNLSIIFTYYLKIYIGIQGSKYR